MKKLFITCFLIVTAIIFYQCSSAKKTTVATPSVTYKNQVHTLVMNNCAPCHIPEKGGNKKPLDTYTSLRESINDVIDRIELNPGERGFMPFKKAKLSDSIIAIFKAWQAQGMAE